MSGFINESREPDNQLRCKHCHQLILKNERTKINEKIVGKIVVKVTAYHACCYYYRFVFYVATLCTLTLVISVSSVIDKSQLIYIWIVWFTVTFGHLTGVYVIHVDKHKYSPN